MAGLFTLEALQAWDLGLNSDPGVLTILLVLGGTVDVRISNHCYLLDAEDFVLINAGEVYTGRAVHKQSDLIRFKLDLKQCAVRFPQYLLEDEWLLNRSFGYKETPEARRRLRFLGRNLYVHLLELYEHPEEPAHLELLLRILGIHYAAMNYSISGKGIPEFQKERLRIILTRMVKNYHQRDLFDQIIAQENITKNYLTQLWKEYFQLSFTEMLNYIRSLRSEQSLLFSSLSIVEIAEIFGFSDTRYYYKAFKKWYGFNPGVWRKKWSMARQASHYERYNPVNGQQIITSFMHRYLEGISIQSDFITQYESLCGFQQDAALETSRRTVQIDLLKRENLGQKVDPAPLWCSLGPLLNHCIHYNIAVNVAIDLGYPGTDDQLVHIIRYFVDLNISMRGTRVVQKWNYLLILHHTAEVKRLHLVEDVLKQEAIPEQQIQCIHC